jgi:hypothetical protein
MSPRRLVHRVIGALLRPAISVEVVKPNGVVHPLRRIVVVATTPHQLIGGDEVLTTYYEIDNHWYRWTDDKPATWCTTREIRKALRREACRG